MKSRLQLKGYVFQHVEVQANPDNVENVDVPLSPKRTYWQADGNKHEWKVLLEVSFGRNDDGLISTYGGKIAVEGFFEVDHAYPEDRIAELISITGSSLLFGAAREMVAIITARGPYKPLLLPSISFYDMDKEAESKKEKPEVKEEAQTTNNGNPLAGEKDKK